MVERFYRLLMFIFNDKIGLKKFLADNSYSFLLSSVSVTFVLWTISAVNNLDIVAEDGHSFLIYFYYTSLALPKIFSDLLPVIFFTTLFYTLIKYENNNELKIFWINGITKIQFYDLILKYTVLFFFIQILLTTLLVPYLQNKGKSFIKESKLDFFPSLFQQKKFIDTVDRLTIFIETKNSNNEFTNIYLKDETDDEPNIIIAKTGKLLVSGDKKILQLLNGLYISINKVGKVTSFNFEKTDFDLSKFLTKTTTYTKLQERKTSELLTCAHSILIKKEPPKNKKGSLNCTYDSIIEIMTETYKRIFKPLYLFVLSSIVIFLLTSNNEDTKFKKIKLFVFFFGIIFIILSEMLTDFSGKNNISLLLSIFFPLMIFLFLYGLFYKRINKMNNRT